MAGATATHQAAAASREGDGQERPERSQRSNGMSQPTQHWATATGPAALDSLSRLQH